MRDKMARELSSNWKKLQAQLKAAPAKPTGKRKAAETDAVESTGLASKKRKVKANEQSPHVIRQNSASRLGTRESTAPKMGAVQSSKITETRTPSLTPALALWAEDNDISTEDIAQAYGLGMQSNSLLSAAESKPNEGLAKGVEVGKYLAMDCEMVGVGPGGQESALARASLVDFHGRQIYDSFVRPKEYVVDWRTHISGVGPRDMRTARDFEEVQSDVAGLLKGRILVGHDVKHDLLALLLEHPLRAVRDTARFSQFKKYGHGPKPALRVLAREILGIEIQQGQHSSMEDARVAMLLFRKFKQGFDVEYATKFSETPAPIAASNGKRKDRKKRKARR
jgi:RNA exonuclease 4